MPKSAPSSSAQVDNLPEILANTLHEDNDHEDAENSVSYALDSPKVKGYFVWRGIRVRFQSHENESDVKEVVVSGSKEDSNYDEQGVTSFQDLFHELRFNIETDEITQWLASDANHPGIQILTDSEIYVCLQIK